MNDKQRIVTLTPETWDSIRALIYDLEWAKSQPQPFSEPGIVMARVQNAQELFRRASWGWIEGEWPPTPGEAKVTWGNR